MSRNDYKILTLAIRKASMTKSLLEDRVLNGGDGLYDCLKLLCDALSVDVKVLTIAQTEKCIKLLRKRIKNVCLKEYEVKKWH